MSDLEQALNGEVPSEEPAQQQIEEPEQATTEQASADDSEQVTEPTGEEKTSTPEAKAEPDPIDGLKAGISAERHKRQEAEQRAQQLEAYIRSQQQQQDKPDFWEDPEKVLGNYAQGLKAQTQQMMTNMSVEMMRTLHDDYDSMEEKFVEYANSNPALVAEMNGSGNPAKFAYDYAKTQERVQQMQDPDYEAKLEAKIRAKIEAELKQKVESDINTKSQLPGTISNERAAGGNKSAPYAPPSLESLIGS